MITIFSAPSNLGLRPPELGSVPGTCKAPEALREAGLFRRLLAGGAIDGGVVLPGRYVDDDSSRAAGQVRNETALVDHARRLGRRIAGVIADGRAPLVIGGDCSLILGAGLALPGGTGLVHIDGHTDFRHPGNSDQCASVAGEDLAAAVGEHWPAVADIDGLGPYFSPAQTVHIGCRDDDEHLDEVRRSLGLALPARESIEIGMPDAAQAARAVTGNASYWLHLDVDVLDPLFMPAVDSPDPGGLNPNQLVELLTELAPTAIGAQVTVFDPDLDPDGRYAALVVDILATGLADLGRQVHP
ncbi:arginase [Cryobacterium sp. MLB-32]|uniref:arginase family protein n=1 Tax=Cryobacterium sp. MLB-32 TaxID=1529318 RepID=UPI0004E6667F|nr:arginase family protein [Cryobacterium sp. MLB-32]KFF59069.1 arginase [Cryobacterium sp. MLB-32]